MLTAHLVIDSMEGWERVHGAVLNLLRENWNINHVTLQPDVTPVVEVAATNEFQEKRT